MKEERNSMDALPDAGPVIQLIEAFRSSKAMFVAVSLGVFDALERCPTQLQDLAGLLGCVQDPLERLLDACVGLSLLEKQDGAYSNTPTASRYLCCDSPYSLAGYILYSDQVSFPLWAKLESAIRQGGPRWKEVFHEEGDIFDQFFRTRGAMRQFLKGMHGFGMLSSPRVVSAFDLSSYRKFVDVGGATGHLAIAALEQYPNMEAVIFDLPRVIDEIRDQSFPDLVAHRLEFAKGDFFCEDMLPNADLYGLGRILHDWGDDKALAILESLAKRLPPGGGVLLAEKLLNEEKSGPVSAHLQSLNMLVCAEGKERTLTEFRILLESAGFTDVRGHSTGTPLDAIFAKKD
jgi:acetylserotonin N-methyltransferase